MTRLIVSEYVRGLGVRHPLACIVRKYGDVADVLNLASNVRSLQEAVSLVKHRRRTSVVVRDGGSTSSELWLDTRAASVVLVVPSTPYSAEDQFDVLELNSEGSTTAESSSQFTPVPPLSSRATTAIFVVIGAPLETEEANRSCALDVMREFKRTCPTAYGQFIPTVHTGRRGA